MDSVSLLTDKFLAGCLSTTRFWTGIAALTENFHGIARLKSLLDLVLSVIVQHLCFLLKEYAEHESIYYEPAVAPEKTEQPLNLVKRDDLSKNAHDPVLAKYHDID